MWIPVDHGSKGEGTAAWRTLPLRRRGEFGRIGGGASA
jgi:hypothetical protein